MYKYSVIIPAYNAEKYISKCIDSLLNQNYKDFEVIVVDDGSTDLTSEIVSQYVEKNNNIKLISQSNLYAGVARNNGMKAAKGEYLYFLDADDYVEESFFTEIDKVVNVHDIDIIIFSSQEAIENNSKKKLGKTVINEFLPDKEIFAGADISDRIYQTFIGWPWDKVFKRSFVVESGLKFQNTRTTNDGFFVYMSLSISNKIYFLNKKLVFHRIGNENSLESTRDKSPLCCLEMLNAIENELKIRSCYNVYRKSFINYKLDFLIWNITTLRKGKAYKELYKTIKPIIMNLISSNGKEIFYNTDNYDKALALIDKDEIEFLLYINYANDLKIRCNDIIIDDLKKIIDLKRWVPNIENFGNSKILLYGAGDVGKDVYYYLMHTGIDVVAWIDKEKKGNYIYGCRIESPKSINEVEFDYVFIAIRNTDVFRNVYNDMINRGIQENKIIIFE